MHLEHRIMIRDSSITAVPVYNIVSNIRRYVGTHDGVLVYRTHYVEYYLLRRIRPWRIITGTVPVPVRVLCGTVPHNHAPVTDGGTHYGTGIIRMTVL